MLMISEVHTRVTGYLYALSSEIVESGAKIRYRSVKED